MTCTMFDAIVDLLREPCVKEWEYDEAVEAERRNPCDDDVEQGDGWYFRLVEGGEEIWVSRAEYNLLTTYYGEDECENDWEFDANAGAMRKEACEYELEAAGADCAWFFWNPYF